MGGYGSGRWGGHPTAEATNSYVLSMKSFRGLHSGLCGSTTFSYADDFEVRIGIDTRTNHPGCIRLAHWSRDDREDWLDYPVALAITPQPFGGYRWWFLWRAERVTKLFLPLGGREFRSRAAYRLGYASQRESAGDRAHRRLARVSAALGQPYGGLLDGCPPRPKGMWSSTYQRWQERWDVSETILNAEIVGLIDRLRGRR
jgi:hypothetical protein